MTGKKGFVSLICTKKGLRMYFDLVQDIVIGIDEEGAYYDICFEDGSSKKFQMPLWKIEFYRPKKDVKLSIKNIQILANGKIDYIEYCLKYDQTYYIRKFISLEKERIVVLNYFLGDDLILGIFNGVFDKQEDALEKVNKCLQQEQKRVKEKSGTE